jgi:DNA-binding NtrC family response regulator
MKILVFEDEKALQDIYNIVFETKGIQATFYDKPSQHKEKLEGISLIISDGQMLGETVMDSLRIKEAMYHDVPLICISANPDTLDIMRGQGYETMQKPIRMKELSAMIDKYVVIK